MVKLMIFTDDEYCVLTINFASSLGESAQDELLGMQILSRSYVMYMGFTLLDA